jgi:outer membrane protein OmpA-like peptidoglycan-associated protein
MNRMTMWRAALLFALVATCSAVFAADNPDVLRLNQRLAALQADPQLGELAPFEQLQARQAVDAFAKAKRSQREDLLYVAEQRVEIAETAARTAATKRELDQLDNARRDLLVEASRQDAARARAETERLRIQAQIQAEEADRLRQSADAEAQARQEAEDTLTEVAGQQNAKLLTAQRKEAQLARQEAELVSGAKLPASKFGEQGEVFTLAGSLFNAGTAKLSDSGKSTASAMAAYLNARPKTRARSDGYGDGKLALQRAVALRDALVAAGISRSRLQAGGKGKASAARAVEVTVLP